LLDDDETGVVLAYSRYITAFVLEMTKITQELRENYRISPGIRTWYLLNVSQMQHR